MNAAATATGALHVRTAGRDWVLHGPCRAVVGRSADADVVVGNRHVSRRHAVLHCDPLQGWMLEDTDSTGGTYLHGRRVQRVAITGTTSVWLGAPGEGERIELRPSSPAWAAGTGGQLRSTTQVTSRVTIGRASDNDIVVADPLVSRYHAEVRNLSATGVAEVIDLSSHHGTFVNGRRVERAMLAADDFVAVARHTFRMVDGALEEYVEPVGASLAVRHITVRAGGQTLLDDVSFTAPAGTLVAVLGPTGCGKSTLLRAITAAVPHDGEVLYDGRDFAARFAELRVRVGHVPQEDILHHDLRLRQALCYAAELRLPADTTPVERGAHVDEVLTELGLDDRANVRIGSLSGGQRKRTNIALELLSRPSVLLLDEPTSGLDPGFEKAVMELLRRLADDGTTVVVVTHDTAHLSLCDRVVALNSAGRVAFEGTPTEMLGSFGTSDYAALFSELRGGRRLRRSRPLTPCRTSAGGTRRSAPRSGPAPRLQPMRRQLSTLIRRQLALVMADRRNLLFAAASVVVPALALMLLVPRGSLDTYTAPHREGFLLVTALVVAGACIGAANTLREIVKERAVHRRERAGGLSIGAYLGSKLAVFGGLAFVQSIVLVRIATLRARGPNVAALVGTPWVELGIEVAMTAVAAVALGLLLSALVSTSEKAMALVAVVFMVEWLFSGATLSLAGKPALETISYVTGTHWGYAAASTSTDLTTLSGRCGKEEALMLLGIRTPAGCGQQAAGRAGAVLVDLGALAVLTAGALGLTGVVLARGDRAATGRGKRARPCRPA